MPTLGELTQVNPKYKQTAKEHWRLSSCKFQTITGKFQDHMDLEPTAFSDKLIQEKKFALKL